MANWTPGFDDNGNPQVLKLQSQNDEDKLSRFMSKVNDDLTFRNGKYYDKNGNEVSDQFPFYDGEYQKFSLAMGLNAKPQVMPDKQFDAMVRQNGLQVLYRGESGQAAADRFMTSDLGHTGTGSYGDGYYFSTEKSTAIDYARMKSGWNGTGKVETMVLSPTARAIRYSDLQNAYNSLSPKLQRALQKAGQSAKGASPALAPLPPIIYHHPRYLQIFPHCGCGYMWPGRRIYTRCLRRTRQCATGSAF